jgi:large subunit ribosomal protein L28
VFYKVQELNRLKFDCFLLLNYKVMSKICELTGKRPIKGNHVSHSNVKTKRRFMPNLKKKRIFVPEIGDFVEVKLSMSALRTVNKLGLFEYVKKLQKKGSSIGFEDFSAEEA